MNTLILSHILVPSKTLAFSPVKVYSGGMEEEDNKLSDRANYNRNLVQSTRGAMLRGDITLAEAKKILAPVIEEMNTRAKELAKEYGVKYHPIKFINLMR